MSPRYRSIYLNRYKLVNMQDDGAFVCQSVKNFFFDFFIFDYDQSAQDDPKKKCKPFKITDGQEQVTC